LFYDVSITNKLFEQLHVALSKNVSKGVRAVLVLVVAELACVAARIWHFSPETSLKASDSDLRLQSELDLLEVGLNCQLLQKMASAASPGTVSQEAK
jgi:hypothetical protein